ncbi:hypothetical protein TNCT_72301, partial [Trichonephila clavata]
MRSYRDSAGQCTLLLYSIVSNLTGFQDYNKTSELNPIERLWIKSKDYFKAWKRHHSTLLSPRVNIPQQWYHKRVKFIPVRISTAIRAK